MKITQHTAGLNTQTIQDSFLKLNPTVQIKNPVMFVVFVGSIATTIIGFLALFGNIAESPGFILAIAFWLWTTVLFANFTEALAEGRGRAKAESLKKNREGLSARRLTARGATLLSKSSRAMICYAVISFLWRVAKLFPVMVKSLRELRQLMKALLLVNLRR